LNVARASYLAGFAATSNVEAGRRYRIPLAGTMAHSYIECFADEVAAFAAFARVYPRRSTLLIDTYDTLEGARRAVQAARTLRGDARVGGVRVGSGDLLALSCAVRAILDAAGLADVTIFASGNLDQREIARLLAADAPIDGFGVGSRLGVSADAPYLDMAYKLVAFDGRPTLKLSDGKATLPGAKQVWRRHSGPTFAGDVVALLDESGHDGAEPLLIPAMTKGKRLALGTLDAARSRAAEQRASLPSVTRRLDAEPYPVELSSSLLALQQTLTREIRARGGARRAQSPPRHLRHVQARG
jgi:nicotinate phosphoribosyltransferase